MKAARTLAFLAAGFFVLASALQAKPRTCRVVFPERPQGSPKSAFLFDGSGSQAVTLPSMNLSEVIEFPAGELTIALTADNISDAKTLSPNAPLLRIPEKLMDFYIILTPDPQNKHIPVKLNLVDAGAGKLNPGETLWYNFTQHRIAAKLGGGEMAIDPGGRTISKDPVPASGYYTAEFVYEKNGKGGVWAPITEQKWWHDSASRHLGFIVNTGGKLPKLYFFRDFRDPDADKEAVPLDQ